MARIQRMNKTSLLFIILTLSLHISAGDDNGEESPVCHRNSFKCYEDCCLKEKMFCHHGQQRCFCCDTRKVLCGNESVPVECLLYCHKIQNPPPPLDSSVRLPLSGFIAGTIGTIVLSVILTLVALAVCARIWPLDKWPLCHRDLLGPNTLPDRFCDVQGEKDPDTALEPFIPPNNEPSEQDVSAGRPLTNDASSTSLSSTMSLVSRKSNAVPNLDELNVTRVNEGDEEDNDGREQARGPPPPAAPFSADSHGPGQGETTGDSSSGGGTLPSQGHGTPTDHCAAGSYGRPQAPQTSPHGLENTRDTEDGNWINGGGLSPAPEGRGLIHRHPDPGSNIEVGQGGFPRGASFEGPQQDRLHSGNNEVPSKPDFSKMNPTLGTDDGNDRHLLATGTENPAKSYTFNISQNTN